MQCSDDRDGIMNLAESHVYNWDQANVGPSMTNMMTLFLGHSRHDNSWLVTATTAASGIAIALFLGTLGGPCPHMDGHAQ